MRWKMNRWKIFNAQKGQSMVELAIILPLLLLLLVGMIDFGRVMYTYMHMHITTQETVRIGGLGRGDVEIEEYARNHFSMGDVERLDIEIDPVDGERKSGDYLTVTLKYPINFITPFASQVFSSPHWLSTDSTIRVE